MLSRIYPNQTIGISSYLSLFYSEKVKGQTELILSKHVFFWTTCDLDVPIF